MNRVMTKRVDAKEFLYEFWAHYSYENNSEYATG